MKTVFELEAYVRGQITSLRNAVETAHVGLENYHNGAATFLYCTRMMNLNEYIKNEAHSFQNLKENYKGDSDYQAKAAVLLQGIKDLEYLRSAGILKATQDPGYDIGWSSNA